VQTSLKTYVCGTSMCSERSDTYRTLISIINGVCICKHRIMPPNGREGAAIPQSKARDECLDQPCISSSYPGHG
jgi:hypothetical protein